MRHDASVMQGAGQGDALWKGLLPVREICRTLIMIMIMAPLSGAYPGQQRVWLPL